MVVLWSDQAGDETFGARLLAMHAPEGTKGEPEIYQEGGYQEDTKRIHVRYSFQEDK